MKNALISFIAFSCCMTMITNAQIPNPGFEDWTAGDPDGWITTNVFPLGLVTVTQTTDNHSGSYAVRGEVVSFFGTPMGPAIQSGPGGEGFPISEQYNSLELYYKFTSIEGDKFSVNVGLEKAGNQIAQGAVALPSTITAYTHLSVPLDYMVNEVPDLAIIQILITGPVAGPDYHLGSVMFVDDLSFSFETGIENTSVPDLMLKCYPNPASGIINVPFNENISGEVILNVFDTYGKKVKEIAGHADRYGKNVLQFSVEDMSSGLYFYSINGQSSNYQGKFTVNH